MPVESRKEKRKAKAMARSTESIATAMLALVMLEVHLLQKICSPMSATRGCGLHTDYVTILPSDSGDEEDQ